MQARLLIHHLTIGCVLLIFALCVVLGFWQLERADEKRKLQQAYAQKSIYSYAAWQHEERQQSGAMPFVRLFGQIVPARRWFLDNQIVNGKSGYDVLVLFCVNDIVERCDPNINDMVMVNLGWVAGDYTQRDVLPEIALPNFPIPVLAKSIAPPKPVALAIDSWREVLPQGERVQSSDALYQWLKNQYDLKGHFIASPVHFVGQEDIDIADNVASLATNFIAEHIPKTSVGFVYHYSPTNMNPEKHTAYAVQWFLLGFVILIIAGYRWFRAD